MLKVAYNPVSPGNIPYYVQLKKMLTSFAFFKSAGKYILYDTKIKLKNY